jgi:molybdate transport system regulatory protein
MEENKQLVLDQDDALLLRRISETDSLTDGAKLAQMSYRNAWDRIKRMEKSAGIKIVETKVGGKAGGGAKLTPGGAALLKDFRRVRKYLFNVLEDRQYMVHAGYKLSARNRITGKITKIEKGPITASVKMTIKAPARLTSIISREAVEDLDLKVGDEVDAIIKSTEVMIAKET